jgi:geranylgeranyl diphosphate synthase type I
MMPLLNLKTDLQQVEELMLSQCDPLTDQTNQCRAAVRSHLGAGGSRLRALLCLDAGRRLGLAKPERVSLAACCELIHNASLVQDDCFDREELRRGQPSIWRAYGLTVAICSGDLMLSAAYGCLTKLTRSEILPRLLEAIHGQTSIVIASQDCEQKAASEGLSCLSAYEQIAIAKSGALLVLPLQLPLIASGHPAAGSDARRLAESFAVAYQMWDDLQDFEADLKAGSLNAISVLMRSGIDLEAARSLIEVRAQYWLGYALQASLTLPSRCGELFVQQAQSLLAKLPSTTALTGIC